MLNRLGVNYVVQFLDDHPVKNKFMKFTFSFDHSDENYLEEQKFIREPYSIREVDLYEFWYSGIYIDALTGAVLDKQQRIQISSLKYPSLIPSTYLSRIDHIDKSFEKSNQQFYFLPSFSTEYYHLWFDGLIYLYFLSLKKEVFTVLIPNNTTAKVKEILYLFQDEFNFVTLKSRFIQLPNLLKFSHVSLDKDTPLITNEMAEFFKLKVVSKKKNIKTFDRIFIGRRDSKTRLIKNDMKIKSILYNFGFKVIYLEDYSIIEQAFIFNNAEIIAGLHGAGFTDLIFCNKKTKVIEFHNYLNITNYFAISKQLDLEYHYILPFEFNFDEIEDPYNKTDKYYRQKLKNTSFDPNVLIKLLEDIT